MMWFLVSHPLGGSRHRVSFRNCDGVKHQSFAVFGGTSSTTHQSALLTKDYTLRYAYYLPEYRLRSRARRHCHLKERSLKVIQLGECTMDLSATAGIIEAPESSPSKENLGLKRGQCISTMMQPAFEYPAGFF
jgi:hypothetical protein